MEVRRVADTVLRCRPASLALLAQASTPTPRWPADRQLASQRAYSIAQRRSFIATSTKYASRARLSSAPPLPPSQNGHEASETSTEKGSHKAQVDKAAWAQAVGPRSTGFHRGEEKIGLSRQREIYMNRGSSADDIMKSMNSISNSSSTGGIDLSRMRSPSSKTSPESTTDMMNAITTLLPKQEKIPLRLSPSTGRAVAIQGNVDLARGFKLMERNVAMNRIRRQSNQQRFHERRGIKKKRLRRERWRYLFMEGFKATVAKVKKLKKQGW